MENEKFLQVAGAELIMKLLQEVRDNQITMTEELRAHTTAFREHAEADERVLKDILRAFPDSDTTTHRQYHESVIEWMQLRNSLVRHCLTAAAAAGFVGAMGWVFYAIWQAIVLEVKK